MVPRMRSKLRFSMWLAIILLSLYSTGCSSQPIQQTQGRRPILTATDEWERNSVQEPVVWKDRAGLYRLMYSGGWNECALGIAMSPDGVTWTKKANNPVIGQGRLGFSVACHFSTFRQDNGVLYVYFSNGVGAKRDSLWVAVSNDDGETFSMSSVTKVMEPEAPWINLANTHVMREGDDWLMFFEGMNSNHIWELGLARGTSPDKFRIETEPLRSLQVIPGEMYGGAQVAKEGDTYHMYYHASSVAGILPTDLFHATSKDLRNWTRDAEPLLVHQGGWEFDQVADAFFFDGFVYYSGCDNRLGREKTAIGRISIDQHRGK